MRIHLIVLSLLFLLGSLHGEEPLRTWTSSDGRSIEGRFVQGDEKGVTLKLKDGRTVAIPFDRLSGADATAAREMIAQGGMEEQRREGVKSGPLAEHLIGEWEKMTSPEGLQYHFFADRKLSADKQYPLCIYLHGSSNTGSGLEKREPGANGFADAAIYDDNPSIIIAPEAPAGTKAFKEIGPKIFSLIDYLVANLPVDRDRIYITGYSMGGMGTWALISERPDLFAAAAPVGGPLGGTPVSSIPKIPIWLHFGELDRGEEFRALSNELQPGNSQFKFTEYPGADHTGFHFKVAKDPEFYEWLFAQKRTN
jgi:predicted esterase